MFYRNLVLVLLVIILIPACVIAAHDPDARVIAMDTRLRVHTTPELASETVAFLDPATTVKVIGRTADQEWLQIRVDEGDEGWVVADYMEVHVDLEPVTVTTDLSVLDRGYALPSNVADSVRQIFQRGAQLGNRPDVFSKVGDSITESPHYLHPIGKGLSNLGDFQYLQGVIDYFSGDIARDGNSFDNTSLAAGTGWSSDAVLNPKWSNEALCLPDESPLACEYRVVRPSVALIMYGTNDTGHFEPETYEYWLRQIVEFSIDKGVIPVLSTIPVRLGYEDKVTEFNLVVAKVTNRYNIPLWDFGGASVSLPAFGLDTDGIHPSIPAGGIKGAADFRASNLYSGYVIRNLTALQMLDLVWKTVR
jgi:hypothetical protein